MCLSDFLINQEFKHNLLFVSKLTPSNLAKNDKCEVNFYDVYCVIQDNVTQKTRGLGEDKVCCNISLMEKLMSPSKR
jgi:hypothetical protein